MAKKKKKVSSVKQIAPVELINWALWEKYTLPVALGILLVLLAIFYFPVLFGGKTFMPPDGINTQCGSPFIKDALSRGIYPLWNPYVFGGMPSFASLHMAPYTDWLGQILKSVDWVINLVGTSSSFTRLLLNYMLFGSFLIMFLRDKKINTGAALLAATALLFAPPIVTYTVFSHNTKLLTAALIPIIFMLTHRLLDRRKIIDLCLLGIFVGFQLLRAHVQICYYTMMMLGLYWIYWLIGEIRSKKSPGVLVQTTAMLAVALLAGLAMSSFLHLSVWEYSHYSIRGGSGSGLDFSYATSWSLPPVELINFIVPSFTGFGGATYWGPMPFTDFPIYLGLVVMLLAGLAMVIRRNKITWFFVGLFIFSLFVAFGKHLPILYGPMFKFLPFFNKFRVPNMISILMMIAVVVLAAYGVDSLMKLAVDPDKKASAAIRKYLFGFGAVVVLIFLVLLLGKSAYLGWAVKAGQNAAVAYKMAMSDGLRALLLFGGTWMLIMLTLNKRRWTVLMPFAFILLVLIDVWPVNNRFMKKQINPVSRQTQYFTETPDITYLKAQQKPFRIMPFNDSRSANWYMYHFIENINGYHAAKLKTYQSFIERFTVGSNMPRNYVQQSARGLGLRNPTSLTQAEVNAQSAFFKLMNIHYIVTPLPLTELDSSMQVVYAPPARGQNGVYQFKHALPRIWFPEEILQLRGNNTILDYMASGSFDPAKTAILEEKIDKTPGDVTQNTALIESYDIHKIVVNVDMKSAALLVFSEMYYPAGWKAFIDGKPTKIYKTDYLLRSVWLEPGNHRVEMIFKPRMFHLGLLLSVVVFVMLVLIAVAAWFVERHRTAKEVQANSHCS
ncbi:YfhO family protein [bacterium]|nr:YfhO family protein [bacterium]